MTLTERFITRDDGRRIRQLYDQDGVVRSEAVADLLGPPPENPEAIEGIALSAKPALTLAEQVRLLQLIGKRVFNWR